MESKFFSDLFEFAEQMKKRLPQTKEGGIIILATDEEKFLIGKIATHQQVKKILKEFIAEEEVSFREVINELHDELADSK